MCLDFGILVPDVLGMRAQGLPVTISPVRSGVKIRLGLEHLVHLIEKG